MSITAIRASQVGKLYQIGRADDKHLSLPEAITRSLTAPFRALTQRGGQSPTDDLWALKDVSFEVPHGQVLGIIGHNGAGKSTLLKILSRITQPTTGEVEIRGRVASLLEVGTGFHPELTGRENIYLNGAILGMRRREIQRKFDEIVEFSEVEKFLDTPVKRYSSGMYVRLAFAVAAHLEPEVLVIDEVLAVGDASFQKKCLGKMSGVAQDGRTVLFVSHNLTAIASLCNRVIMLDRGQLIADGTPAHTIQRYTNRMMKKGEDEAGEYLFGINSEKAAQFTRARVLNRDGACTSEVEIGDPFQIELEFEVRTKFPTLHLQCHVHRTDGAGGFGSIDSDWLNYQRQLDKQPMEDVFPRAPGRYRAVVQMPGPFLNSGTWEAEILLHTGSMRQDTQRILFEVTEDSSYSSFVHKGPRGGVVSVPLRWEVNRLEAVSAG
jgi:lipopolysaccharide transport system ATP-binding protein